MQIVSFYFIHFQLKILLALVALLLQTPIGLWFQLFSQLLGEVLSAVLAPSRV